MYLLGGRERRILDGTARILLTILFELSFDPFLLFKKGCCFN